MHMLICAIEILSIIIIIINIIIIIIIILHCTFSGCVKLIDFYLVIAVDNGGDRKSNFVFALGFLCKCMRNKSRLATIFFLCRANLPRFDARIWPHFHVKFHTSPLSSTHKLACRPHFLICDYCC